VLGGDTLVSLRQSKNNTETAVHPATPKKETTRCHREYNTAGDQVDSRPFSPLLSEVYNNFNTDEAMSTGESPSHNNFAFTEMPSLNQYQSELDEDPSLPSAMSSARWNSKPATAMLSGVESNHLSAQPIQPLSYLHGQGSPNIMEGHNSCLVTERKPSAMQLRQSFGYEDQRFEIRTFPQGVSPISPDVNCHVSPTMTEGSVQFGFRPQPLEAVFYAQHGCNSDQLHFSQGLVANTDFGFPAQASVPELWRAVAQRGVYPASNSSCAIRGALSTPRQTFTSQGLANTDSNLLPQSEYQLQADCNWHGNQQ
jgi:hypothetical protein